MGDAEETILVTPVDSPHGFSEEDEWDETLAQINLNFQPQENVPVPADVSKNVYEYENVRIEFPYPAYKSQQQMMERIIKGVTTGENCLLESPTGTGKTAALLCALLGWQKDCYARKDNCWKVIEAAAKRRGGCTCGLIKDEEKTKVILCKKKNELFFTATTTYETEETSDNDTSSDNLDRNNKLILESPSPRKTPTKTHPSSGPGTPCGGDKRLSVTPSGTPSPSKRQKQNETSFIVEEKNVDKACDNCVKKNLFDRSRPPRIIYCTRTHSQITQVIKQLKVTAYRDVKMTILAGREPTCINERTLACLNPNFSKESQQPQTEPKIGLDDCCRTLVKNYKRRQKMREKLPNDLDTVDKEMEKYPVCEYFDLKHTLAKTFSLFQARGAWDIEDIKREGMECGACPYYGSHALQGDADIIFGSYNYLLVPSIRKAKEVKYINSVLVFDEAHNIEDICRNVFSFNIEVDKFDKNYRELVDSLLILAQQDTSHVHSSTMKCLNGLSILFKKWSDKIKELGDEEVRQRQGQRNRNAVKINDIKKPYESAELLLILEEMDLTAETITGCLQALDGDPNEIEDAGEEYYLDSRNREQPFKIPFKISEYLKGINEVLFYLHGQEKDGIGGIKDFKGYLVGEANPSRKSKRAEYGNSRRSQLFLQAQPVASDGPEFFFKFEIHCLNPALGFRRLRSTAYSIIVASGTLTPLNSFASELATNFEVKLQAEHVIPKENVWAGVVSTSPQNLSLRLTKDRQNELPVQDELGQILVEICYTVPNGVLVFFPSYTLMRKLEERWRNYPINTSVLQRISKIKMIFTEESKDKKAFQANMEKYKEFVKGGNNCNGCILFAVFRGKISEGIDFADEQARAVVTIGIPYSNAGAAEIVSKKKYNDNRVKNLQPGQTFLSGSEWYTTQAFRAMNQGFGRCVRHCKDWGALILIDSRLTSQSHKNYISGWVRNNLQTYQTFTNLKAKLEQFIHKMKNKVVEEENAAAGPSREHITIEYDLNETEVILHQDDACGEMNSQDDMMLTQIVDQHDYDYPNMTTQRVPPSSTPIPQEDHDVSHVGPSSDEDSFSEEVQLVLGSQNQDRPPPTSPIAWIPGEINVVGRSQDRASNNSSSCPSVFDKTPPPEDDEFNSDEDNELLNAMEGIREEEQCSHNHSQIFDVSMPSADCSQMSLASNNISFPSDTD